jgi:hypothetical protein
LDTCYYRRDDYVGCSWFLSRQKAVEVIMAFDWMGLLTGGMSSAISGGLSMLGSMSSAKSASSGAADMNAANSAEAQKNRDFQLMMSSTAHQREVEDLRKAGLNPILSATGGSGASTGAGSVIPMQNTQEQAALIKSQMANLAANTAKVLAETKTEYTKQGVNDAQKDALQGTINIPGVGSMPVNRVAAIINSAKAGSVGRIKAGFSRVGSAFVKSGLSGASSMIGALTN